RAALSDHEWLRVIASHRRNAEIASRKGKGRPEAAFFNSQSFDPQYHSANHLLSMIALRWPVAADFSPANGLSLRIAQGYFVQLPLCQGCCGALSSSTRRASAARVWLPN